MAVTHSDTALNAATDAVVALLGSSPNLVFRLSGSVSAPGTAVATLAMAATPFGAASAGVATAGTITDDTNATGNASPVANATIQTSGGTVHIHFGVAASGSDMDFTGGLTIASGDTVSCTSLTYKTTAG